MLIQARPRIVIERKSPRFRRRRWCDRPPSHDRARLSFFLFSQCSNSPGIYSFPGVITRVGHSNTHVSDSTRVSRADFVSFLFATRDLRAATICIRTVAKLASAFDEARRLLWMLGALNSRIEPRSATTASDLQGDRSLCRRSRALGSQTIRIKLWRVRRLGNLTKMPTNG